MAQTKKEPTNKTSKKQVTILAWNMVGKYNLPYNYGQKVKLDAKLAKELIENGDAK